MSFTLPPPLDGILVVDLSRVLAGPFCTQMLGDMGATVIKVEEPEHGDDARSFAPPFWEGESAYYLSANRSKRSLAINLKCTEGRDLVRRLAAQAHIVVENFRPGTAERLGLGYADLSATNPGLVYVSVSGFGQTGPDSARPGYDLIAQGMGGLMSLTGEVDGPPIKEGVPQADLTAGLYATIGALLGLISRERTGKGQHVDIALLDAQASLLTFAAMGWFATERPPRRTGNRHATIAPYAPFRASDGYFTLAVGNDRLWDKLVDVIGRPEMALDARFVTNPDRVLNVAVLTSALEDVFRSRTVQEWIERFDAAGIPAGPILDVPGVLAHPQVTSRDMVVEVEHPTIGTMQTLGNPVKLSATPAQTTLPPPLLGQHTEEILRVFLDLKDAEIEALESSGVIRQSKK